MPRKRTATEPEPSAAILVHVIDPAAVYTLVTARQALSLPKSALPREIRAGRLRCSKRLGRYWILGRWLLEWVEAGELRKRQTATTETNGHQ